MIQHPNYTVKNLIGQGGMATVYLANHNTLNKPVAIKLLNKEFIHNENVRKRFLAEARNLFSLNHPNIIKVTDLIDDGDTVAFVMEYMEGQTLKDYLDTKSKLTDEEIKKLFVQMLDAVGYVHDQGLIHRDIKPSNFMITSKGLIKLLDFGIAKNTDTTSSDYTQTGTTQNMGTPMYMSPEQIKSTKDVTAQTDIYSLGVVLWQMVTGKKPYDTITLSTFELQTKIVTENLASTNSLFDGIITKATAKNIEDRISSCEKLKNQLLQPNLNNFESTILNEDKVSEFTVFHEEEKEKNFMENEIITPLKDIADTETIVKKKKSNNLPLLILFILVSIVIIGLLRYNIEKNQSGIYDDSYPNNSSASELTEESNNILADDDKKLQDYFKMYDIKVSKTPLGAYVEMIQPGTGPIIDTSVVVKVDYTGRTLDGKMFDSNTYPSKGHVEPFYVNMTNDMSLLGSQVIEGWTDCLKMLNKGAKARFYIPSSLGYGKQKIGEDIPANSILVFEIEVLDILNRTQAKIEDSIKK